MDAPPAASSDQSAPTDDPPPPRSPQSPRHHRRSRRFASPYASSPQSPALQDPAQTDLISFLTMNADPNQPAPPAASSNPSRARPNPPNPEGQNHDRMETDDDSSDVRSHSGTNTPEQSDATTEPGPQPALVSEESMALGIDLHPPAANSSSRQPAGTSSGGNLSSVAPATLRFGITASVGINAAGNLTILDTPSLTANMNGVDHPTGEIRLSIPPSAIEPIRSNRQPPPPHREDSVDSGRRRERRGEERDRDRDDATDDDSSDDDENPFWASFKEDTSVPDERELKVIEESEKNLPTGIDHEHWEKTTFEELDDPEYEPADIGRISWTVKGVHGTPDQPNRETMMKSPSVRIGDYYWYIKYYPRGNDGTEHVSVYIECSPTRWEDDEKGEDRHEENGSKDDASMTDVPQGTPSTDRPDSESRMNGGPPEQAQSQSNASDANDVQMNGGPPETSNAAPSGQPPSNTNEPTSTNQDSNRLADADSSKIKDSQKNWRVAAQVCCVMYNPNEPRVYASSKISHSYYPENPDWGWTRFHGPWDDLHNRKRYSRTAMLRDDTIAFTAYIRIVKDETGSLWWHPPKDKAGWDCVEMTGVRAFALPKRESLSSLIAAISAWLHLTPFLDMVRTQQDASDGAGIDSPPRPIANELESILEQTGKQSDKTRDLSLTALAEIMDANSFDGISKMDVVSLWEHLRRLMTYELSTIPTMEAACNQDGNVFDQMLLLKQPDHFKLDSISTKFMPDARDTAGLSADCEPTSVQMALDLASQHPDKAFRVWECFPNQQQSPLKTPQVLSIELHRQHFDQVERKWIKLGHRIALDDEVTFSSTAYSLYGMIVHNGSLESQDFCTVIRPGGPGSRWIKYSEDRSRKVSLLTTKQAVSAHEGTGDPSTSKKSKQLGDIDPVAYIAMYVRKDALQITLETPFNLTGLPETNKPEDESDESSFDNEDAPTVDIPVDFYYGKAFSGTNQLETLNYRATNVSQREDFRRLTLPDNLKIAEVEKILELGVSKLLPHSQSKSVRLWTLDGRDPCLGPWPAFLQHEMISTKTLRYMLDYLEGCHFWLDGQERDTLGSLMASLKDADPRKLLRESETEHVNASSSTAEADAPTSTVQAPTSNESSEHPTNTEGATSSAIEQPDHNESGDTVMRDAQDSENNPPPVQPNDSHDPPPAAGDAPEEKKLLCFLKIFDLDTQTLTNVKSFLTTARSNAMEEIRKALDVDAKPKTGDEMGDADAEPEEWDIYNERYKWKKAYRLVDPDSNIESYLLANDHLPLDLAIVVPSDGLVFIAQRRPTPAQQSALEAAGKPTTVPQFISYLLATTYQPSFAAPYRTSSYLGSPYFSGSQSYARPHGQGTLVTMSGDAYTGPFVSGQKAGDNGEMIFANKDVYTGSWAADLPHGDHGRMVYAKTGNVYQGGWKRGRRHGRGEMRYEVADEEMRLCQVCYEEEMDALFYHCGHVCACEGCAKQVENCPVCRERVRGVVKVRWTV